MTINQRASDAIDPNDPVFQYLTGAPPPRSSIDQSDIDKALAQLKEAARLATVPDAAGKRWVPGLSIVVVGREGDNYPVRYCAGHGTKSVEANVPVGPDTLFPCASLSKPVSTTLLAAAGAGVDPSWEEPVNQPPGPNGPSYHLAKSSAQETLRQWLSHRSGMPDHGGDLIEDLNPAMLRHDLFARIMKYQIGIKPGEFRYTNFGFTMGCYGAMIALGPTNWEAFASDALSKLGMSRSTYTFTSAFAGGHADRVRPHQGKPESSDDLLSRQPTGWTWHVVDPKQERNPTRQAPAGSLLSSANDLGRFLDAHLRPPRFDNFPPRNRPPEEPKDRSHWYSLGWNVTNRGDEDAFKGALNATSFSHSGAFSLGAGTCLRFDPDAGFGIAILSNGEPTGVPEALVQLFFKYLYGQPMPEKCDHAGLLALSRMLTMGEMYKQKIANDERYHGKTVAIPGAMPQGEIFRGHSDYYDSDIAVEHIGGDLFLMMGKDAAGRTRQFRLHCFNAKDSVFVYETTGENEVGLSALQLKWEGGVVVRVVDDWLNGVEPGEQGTGLGEIERLR